MDQLLESFAGGEEQLEDGPPGSPVGLQEWLDDMLEEEWVADAARAKIPIRPHKSELPGPGAQVEVGLNISEPQPQDMAKLQCLSKHSLDMLSVFRGSREADLPAGLVLGSAGEGMLHESGLQPPSTRTLGAT